MKKVAENNVLCCFNKRMDSNLSQIILQYKEDKQSVFNTWFINNEERLKAFRSIRSGVMQVIEILRTKNSQRF